MAALEVRSAMKIIVLLAVVTLIRGYDVEMEIKELKKMLGDDPAIDKPLAEHQERYKRSIVGTYCHDKLGCFPVNGGFSERPIYLKPNSREVVNTQFKLYTRETPTTGQKIRADDINSIKASVFKSSRPTKFIIHGFLESTAAAWFEPMTAELLAAGDYNVIKVDWGGLGASKTLYTQATANARIVGAEIAYLVRTMKSAIDLDYSSVHLIGHSLGAHICGYAGANITGLGRISGLDPAEPYFEGYKESVRLDPSDAQFVDVIHTDADSIVEIVTLDGGLGLLQPSGHADFYPNGGKDQPNCRNSILKNIKMEKNNIYEGLRRFIGCDHDRALRLYTASINSCSFTGYQCSNVRDFEDDKCTVPCRGDSCNKMGFHAKKPSRPLTKYYLRTSGNEKTKFCVKTFDFEVTVDSKSPDIKGSIYLKIRLSNGQNADLTLNSRGELLKSGSRHTYRLSVPNVDEKLNVYVTSLSAKWNRDISWWKVFTKACNFFGFCGESTKLYQIKVTSLMNTRTSYFCGNKDLKSGKDINLLYSSKQC